MRAVVFDLFHTLVDPEDHRPPDFHRAEAVADVLGVPVEPFVRWWDDLEEARTRGTAPPNTELFAQAADVAGVEVTDGTLAEADRIYGRYQDMALREPRPEVLEAVQALRDADLPLGLVSNAEDRDVRAWTDSPLSSLIDAAVFSCHTRSAKPEQLPYAIVIGALGFPPPGKVTYIGDGGSDELTGARGMFIGRVIAARWFVPGNGLRTEEEQQHLERDADVAIHDISEIPDRV